MPARGRRRRARSGFPIALAVAVLAISVTSPLAAQDPDGIPPDTVRGGVAVPIPPEAVASDTLPGDSIMPARRDSLAEAPELPLFPRVLPTGWAFGRIELSREELLRYRGLSLLDLLEHVPGLVITRSGGFGRTAGVSTGGIGGGAVRVFLDGYELDPIGNASPELQAIGLIDLETVRVERGPAGVRVDLATFRLPDEQPYSEVEAAAGNYATRLLRATLARVAGSRSVFAASYDLVSTTGVGLPEPFEASGGRLSWSYRLTPSSGIKMELRQGSASRGGEAYPMDVSRRDLLLRGRSEPIDGLTVEGLVGRTWWSPEVAEAGPGETPGIGIYRDVARSQGLLRAAWMGPSVDLEASARIRSNGGAGAPAPSSEYTLRAAATPLPWATAEAEFRVGALQGANATGVHAGARIGPFGGLSAFASVSTGDRFAVLGRDSMVTYTDTVRIDTVAGEPVPVTEERTRLETVFSAGPVSAAGTRFGGEFSRWGATVGGALVTVQRAIAVPFGFDFDRGIGAVDVNLRTGIEAYAYLPVPRTRRELTLQGSASLWDIPQGRPYLPNREARLALEYHTVRIEGQFEPTIRLEAVHRGPTLVPSPGGGTYGARTEPYSLINFFLQIRIIDVRAFLIWENPTHNRLALDLPEGVGFQPGQRVIYGARWMFRN